MVLPQKPNMIVCLKLLLILIIFIAIKSKANEYEFTPYIGYMFSSDLQQTDSSAITVSDDVHLGFAIAWHESSKGRRRGQGQILINYVSHKFSTSETTDNKFDLIYAHFSGVGFYGKTGYITTLGLGFGASYIKSSLGDSFYPSSTIAIGTRYLVSKDLTLVTELRAYATLIKEDDNIFCNNTQCLALFDGAVWLDTSISVGFAYKF